MKLYHMFGLIVFIPLAAMTVLSVGILVSDKRLPEIRVSDIHYPEYYGKAAAVTGVVASTPKFTIVDSRPKLLPGSDASFPAVNSTVFHFYFFLREKQGYTPYIVVFLTGGQRDAYRWIKLNLTITVIGIVEYTPETVCWVDYCPNQPVGYLLTSVATPTRV